jgi:RNA polymerase sigma-70 factor (ECF subfamily)
MIRDRGLLIAEIPHLRRYALALTRDPDLADDLVQTCLERGLSRFKLWQPSRKIRPWLFTIMHNLHVDMVRHSARRGVSLPLDEMPEQPSQAAGQEAHLNVRAVLDEIDKLPRDQRDVLILIGIDELSYAEAAGVLSIPLGTLMSRLHRARSRLRERLGMAGSRPPIRRVK